MTKEEVQLRSFIRESIKDAYMNMHTSYDSRHLLRMMMDSPGILDALQRVNSPIELAQFLDAIIDACPVVKRTEVLDALRRVTSYETQNRKFK